jgi:hypothetical protein
MFQSIDLVFFLSITVEINSLKDQLLRFELTGAKAHSALYSVLRLAKQENACTPPFLQFLPPTSPLPSNNNTTFQKEEGTAEATPEKVH